jgi:hypothetical protein
MNEMKVPVVRRWFMWAAVSIGTTLKRSVLWKVLTVLWLVGYAVATASVPLTVLGLVSAGQWAAGAGRAALILVSPVILSVMWGRRYGIGLIAAYTVVVLVVPLIAVGVATGIYLLVEQACKPFVRRRGQPAHPVFLKNLEISTQESETE